MSDYISAKLRAQITQQSQYRCAYCHLQERLVGTSLNVDHIHPRSIGGKTVLANLCLACWDCNLIKGARVDGVDPLTEQIVRLFHPNRQVWAEHFQWREAGLYVVGQTASGRATVETLRLNRIQLVISRQFWIEMGWHPPHD